MPESSGHNPSTRARTVCLSLHELCLATKTQLPLQAYAENGKGASDPPPLHRMENSKERFFASSKRKTTLIWNKPEKARIVRAPTIHFVEQVAEMFWIERRYNGFSFWEMRKWSEDSTIVRFLFFFFLFLNCQSIKKVFTFFWSGWLVGIISNFSLTDFEPTRSFLLHF